MHPGFGSGMTCGRSVQLAQQFGKIAVARLRRRGLEGAAESGGDAGMGRRNVHTNDSAVHEVEFRSLNIVSFEFHLRC